MRRSLLTFVLVAMFLGFATGLIIHSFASPQGVKLATDGFSQITNVFLRLIKMIIAPLVLTSLTSGIGRIEGTAAVGRIGGKAMAWFIVASIVALLIGFAMANLLQPGAG